MCSKHFLQFKSNTASIKLKTGQKMNKNLNLKARYEQSSSVLDLKGHFCLANLTQRTEGTLYLSPLFSGCFVFM